MLNFIRRKLKFGLNKVKDSGGAVTDNPIVIEENIPHKNFADAMALRIVTQLPIFELNGIKFYTFEKDLSMISAQRYLLLQQDANSRDKFGMSLEVAQDYVNESIDDLLSLRGNMDDTQFAEEKLDKAILGLRIFKEHQLNFNVIGAMLELCSLTFITASEDPYSVDYVANLKKISLWDNAISNDNSGDFLRFFWKLGSLKSMDYTSVLVNSMKHLAKDESQMTSQEITERESSRNLLAWELSVHRSYLEELLAKKTLRSRVRSLRLTLSLAKFNLNNRAYSTIFNIKS